MKNLDLDLDSRSKIRMENQEDANNRSLRRFCCMRRAFTELCCGEPCQEGALLLQGSIILFGHINAYSYTWGFLNNEMKLRISF